MGGRTNGSLSTSSWPRDPLQDFSSIKESALERKHAKHPCGRIQFLGHAREVDESRQAIRTETFYPTITTFYQQIQLKHGPFCWEVDDHLTGFKPHLLSQGVFCLPFQ